MLVLFTVSFIAQLFHGWVVISRYCFSNIPRLNLSGHIKCAFFLSLIFSQISDYSWRNL